jgi:hypothetical protein
LIIAAGIGELMNDKLTENTLLNTEEKHEEMARLIILKLAATWLEKQDWVSSPYGGQNPVQDLLFHAQLAANRVWEDFFSKKENNVDFDAQSLQKKILEIADLTPELKDFFHKRLNAPFEQSFTSGM